MWAQNISQRSPLPGQPGQQVARPGFGRAGGVVLADLEPERPQLGGDRVGDLALLPGRAADLAEPDERLVQPDSTAGEGYALLSRGAPDAGVAASRSPRPARSSPPSAGRVAGVAGGGADELAEERLGPVRAAS